MASSSAGEMTPKHRFLTALGGGEPDHVPCAPLIHHRYAHQVAGESDWRAVFEVHRRLGTVAHRGPIGIGWSVPSLPAGFSGRSEVVAQDGERIATRRWVTTPRGELTSLHVSGFVPGDPLVGKTVEPLVKEASDWATYAAWLEALAENGEPDTSQARLAFRVMGEEGVASVGIGGVFAHLGDVRDMQPLLYDLYDCPTLLETCAAPLLDMNRRTAEAFAELPNEVAWLDICWATGAEVSLPDLDRWALRDARAVFAAIHARPGKHVGFYTLGRIRRYMPAMIDAGADFIETFEPNMGDLSLADAKRLYGDRVCVMGNFDCLVLARGTADDARREARRCLSEAMEGGRYVMVTADEVPADARWDNLQAMADVCREEGRYR